jgi:hypothetical protein
MEVNVIIALIGLIGISLGAFLSGMGYYLKVKSERLKTKKNVLYHLLEIRSLIKSEYVNPGEISNAYFDYCEDYFSRKGLLDSGKPSEEMKSVIEAHVKSLTETMKPKMDIDFIRSFEKSISALSLDHPVLAFKLRGRDKIEKILAAQSIYVENLNIFFDSNTPEDIKEASKNHAGNLNYEVIEELIKDMDHDIRNVSSKCGPVTWLLVRKILKQSKKNAIIFKPEEMDPVFDKFISVLVEAANKSSKRDAVTGAPS